MVAQIVSGLDTTTIVLRTIWESWPSDSLCCNFASDPALLANKGTDGGGGGGTGGCCSSVAEHWRPWVRLLVAPPFFCAL